MLLAPLLNTIVMPRRINTASAEDLQKSQLAVRETEQFKLGKGREGTALS